ncbi:hypothetical protein BKA62DRAFT_612867 [Auriculariales sp. MPI-PUGE-AT-0066]|nr:hypothetical protein BKA62DRAFT_612867 [Auriculariales sp. MPI-PUGE-AT-0066]
METPRTSRDLRSLRDRSSFISVTRASAVEVHAIVYGNEDPTTNVLDRLYENPLLTTSSRDIITDIHFMTRQLAELDIPRPSAVFATLFGKREQAREPWFQGCRIWSEIGDVLESDSFDDARVAIIEHTMHIVLLPQLHSVAPSPDQHPSTPSLDVVSTTSLPAGIRPAQQTYSTRTQAAPAALLSLAGGRIQVPSPLHMQMRVTTRLSFNEAGRITHHRDSWDVRDLVGLVPGMGLAAAVATRIAALGLSASAHLLGHRRPLTVPQKSLTDTLPTDRHSSAERPGSASAGSSLGLDVSGGGPVGTL